MGELNFSNKEYIEALKNYQKAIDFLHKNNLSDPSKLLNAICSSLFCYELLNENQLAKETFNELVCQVALLNDELENVDWFRNSPVYDNFIMNSIRSVPKIMLTDLPSMDSEEFCQFQCNGYAVAVACACTKVPNLAIQAVCLGCVFGLEQLCIRCCKGEGFWENCVKGLRRLFHDPEHPENPAPHPYE